MESAEVLKFNACKCSRISVSKDIECASDKRMIEEHTTIY